MIKTDVFPIRFFEGRKPFSKLFVILENTGRITVNQIFLPYGISNILAVDGRIRRDIKIIVQIGIILNPSSFPDMRALGTVDILMVAGTGSGLTKFVLSICFSFCKSSQQK